MSSNSTSIYRLYETSRFQKDLEQILRGGTRSLEAKLRSQVYPKLRQRPHFGPHIKKLKAFEPDTWRYRVGRWRFFYEIDEDEKIVFLIGASHRGSAY